MLASFIVLIIGYSAVIYVRFCLLESWGSLPAANRFAYGLLNVVLGVGLMAGMSNLAVRVPDDSQKPSSSLPGTVPPVSQPQQSGKD